MGFELSTEGSVRAHNQKQSRMQNASAGIAGGNMGLTTGGSAGTETGIEDASAANILRLRGNQTTAGGNPVDSGNFQHWSPA